MDFALVLFTEEHLESAVGLFIENYRRERGASPLLPSRVIDDSGWIRNQLQSCLTNPGVAIIGQNQLLGYMVTGMRLPWKGQQSALVPEYCHAATLENQRELYQRMYMHLSQEWVNNDIHLHIIGHFAHDTTIRETFYQIGFGAILVEQLRDFSTVPGMHEFVIVEETDVSKLIDLQIEHMLYYPKAPIFIRKTTEKDAVVADLSEHAQNGDALLVYYDRDEPRAYAILGSSAIGAEGFLLQNTNTAQIKSAYARRDIRGRGVGKALLQCAVDWSQQHGYERLFVEHESANFYGGNFWCKHFTPYVYFSMRYIDTAI